MTAMKGRGHSLLAASVIMLWVFYCNSVAAAAPARLAISCGALGVQLRLCQEGVEAWSRQTGTPVKVVATPNSSTERFALYQQILASHSPDIDVFQIDVVWPGTFAPHLVDLSSYIDGRFTQQFFQTMITNNTIDGALVAMPWYTDAGVLFYRKDLLQKYGRSPPQTWQQLTESARIIQNAERAAGNTRMQGFVFQAKGYEGLTCDALEWIDSFNGGTLVNSAGKVTLDNARAAAALDLAASWIGDIAPKGVLNYDEEASRGVFQSGNAGFRRNGPSAGALGNAEGSPIRGRIGVMALPRGGDQGHPSATLGGWQLAVSRYSRHPALAADLVRYLTSYAEQKRRAIAASYNPTIKALYQDQEVLAAVPFFGTLYDSFEHAVARPSRVTGSKYARVSAEFYYTVHDVLSGKSAAAPALAALQKKLIRLSRGEQW